MNPTDKPARYFVDDATVHVGLFGLIFSRPTYTFKVHALKGVATGEVGLSTDETRLRVDGGGVELTGVPAIQQSVGLPIEGTLAVKLDVVAPKGLAAMSNGTFELNLDDAAVGDGKAKLTVPGDPFLAQGVTFPRIKLGKISGQGNIEKGRAALIGFAAHSADVDVTLEGYVELRDPIGMSQLHAFLKFKPSEALLKREPTVELMNNALGGMAKRPDGYIGFQMTGPLSAVFVFPNKEPPPGVTSRTLPAGAVPSLPATAGGGPAVLPPPLPPLPPLPTVGGHGATAAGSQEPEDAPQPPPPSLPPPPIPPPTGMRPQVNRALEQLGTATPHGEDPPGNPPTGAPSPEGTGALPSNQKGE